MRNFLTSAATALLLTLAACGPKVPSPDSVTLAEGTPDIFPDYTSVTVPPNIAPLNFEITDRADEALAVITAPGGETVIASGPAVQWPETKWRQLLEQNRGRDLEVAVYTRNASQWTRRDFTLHVAPEEIDRYFSYRLIEPSFVYFNLVELDQRDLTSWDVKTIHNNWYSPDETTQQCMNCHVARNNNADNRSQFHIRNANGGTVIIEGDKVRKVRLATDSVPSAGVYPAWHPALPLIAYSINGTQQYFHTRDPQKVEVLDQWSDLTLYDLEHETVRRLTNTPEVLETFPAWGPEGTRLYYSAARRPAAAPADSLQVMYDSVRYDILSLPFDPSTRRFTSMQPDTVLCVSQLAKSASLPRVSPDGRFLLTCVGDYGTFHIWHRSSDLWLTDLKTGATRPLEAANSDDTDSYHSWSSNSRWVIFSSRRDDKGYTRPYITYVDSLGNATKAFAVPQKNPRYYKELGKSFNVPEFLVNPVMPDRDDILRAARGEALQVRDDRD